MENSKRVLLRSFIVGGLLACSLLVSACSMFSRRSESVVDPDAKRNSLEQALSELSLQKLDQANLVFRVAFEKSLDTWQGPGEDAVPGCKISGKDAENGLAAIKPWLSKRAGDEAKRAVDSPKSYQLPFDVETCERDCSCGIGLAIFDAADLDSQTHQRVKDLKKLRTRVEAKSELMTRDRAELCAESATWICSSDVLKALQPGTGKSTR